MAKLTKSTNENRARNEWSVSLSGEKLAPVQPEQYVGRFEHRGYGFVDVSSDKSGLFATYNNLRYTLVPKREKNVFRALSFFPTEVVFECSFVRDSSGGTNVSGFRMTLEPMLPPILFTKKLDDVFASRMYLASFVGTFENDASSIRVFINEKTGLSIAIGSSQYSGDLKVLGKRNWFNWQPSLEVFVRADGQRSIYEFIVADGNITGVNEHTGERIIVFKKANS